jgi:type VI secretion system protein ImpJ
MPQIGSILNSAVNGARLELEYRPPAALPIKPGMTFFRIDRQNAFFRDAMTTGTLAIYLPFPKDEVSLALYAVDQANLR